MKNKMSYEKCYNCNHSIAQYVVGGGILISCQITGKQLKIEKCPEKELVLENE